MEGNHELFESIRKTKQSFEESFKSKAFYDKQTKENGLGESEIQYITDKAEKI